MASSSPKQLREHLREQQEPFDLHIYILERIVLHHSNQGCKCNVNKRKLYEQNILKMIICKFIRHKVQKYDLMSKMVGKLGLIGGNKRNSCICTISCSLNQEKPALHLWRKSQSNIHIGFKDKKVAIYTTKLGESDGNRQPASSKAKGDDDDDDDDESRFQFGTEKLNEAVFKESNRKDDTISSGLQNSEQLLIDSTNNASKMHEREATYEKCNQGFPGLEEVRKIQLWRNQNPIQNMNFDFSNVTEDWSDMQKAVKWKVMIEIGDAIIEKMIQELI